MNTSNFQQNVGAWIATCFAEQPAAANLEERAQRFLEEAVETVQACGMPIEHAHQLVDYVYNRPVGDFPQEVGGVMVTLAGLCNAAGINLDAAAWAEIARCWANVEKIRAKNATKKAELPTPGTAPAAPSPLDMARAEAEQQRIEEEAWQLYVDATRGNPLAATSWAQLPNITRQQYIEQVLATAGRGG